MMTLRRRIFVALLSTLGLLASPFDARSDLQAGTELTILTEDYPPLNFVSDGTLQGPSVQMVNAIRARLGTTSEIKVYPWARAYKLVETQKNTALFSMTRSAKREDTFKWVGPLAEKKIGLFALKNSGIEISNLDDARPYLIGVQVGGYGMDYLVDRGFDNFDASTTPMANLKKLLKGRNDLWFASNATVSGNAKQSGISPNELELVLTLETTFMYIAFNRETDDSVIAQWQGAFDDLVKEGVLLDALAQHGLENLHPTFE